MNFMLIGSIFGFFCVVLGAFAAHGLKSSFSTYQLDIWQTAVFYQFIHAVMLVLVGWMYRRHKNKLIYYSGVAFVFGCLLFSGSLYALAVTSFKILGAITPVGGSLFIIGWGLLATFAWNDANLDRI